MTQTQVIIDTSGEYALYNPLDDLKKMVQENKKNNEKIKKIIRKQSWKKRK